MANIHHDDALRRRLQEVEDRARAVRRRGVSVELDGEVIVPDLFPEVRPTKGEDANQRYTTTPTLTWCKQAVGVDAFDLDVAACAAAHHAPRWYRAPHPSDDGVMTTTERHVDGSVAMRDGLYQPWRGPRVWCNPPFDDIEVWVAKAWVESLVRHEDLEVIAMLLPSNREEQEWWQHLVEPFRDGRRERLGPHAVSPALGSFNARVACDSGVRLYTHRLPGRVRFGFPGNPEARGETGSPPFGCVLLEWRIE